MPVLWIVLLAFFLGCSHSNSNPSSLAPTFSPESGYVSTTGALAVTITAPLNSGATQWSAAEIPTICYTTNGSTPTTTATATTTCTAASQATSISPWTIQISVATSEVVNAFIIAANFSNSPIVAANYTILSAGATQIAPPSFGPLGGVYTSGPAVTLSSLSSGAAILYTTDESTPALNSDCTLPSGTEEYTGPIQVSNSTTTTLNAVATSSQPTTIPSPGACASPLYSSLTRATYVLGAPLIDFNSFCSGVNSAVAKAASSCKNSNPDLDASYLSCADLSAAVELPVGAPAGTGSRIVFDSTQHVACETAVGALGANCSLFLPGTPLPQACTNAIVGQVPQGAFCYNSLECSSGYCSSDLTKSCPGTCVAYTEAGEDCSKGLCDPQAATAVGVGLACVSNPLAVPPAYTQPQFFCQPSSAGAVCPCLPGFFCSAASNTCAAVPSATACTAANPCSCAADDNCPVGFVCGATPPICQPLLPMGATCDLTCSAASPCAAGFTCVGITCQANCSSSADCASGSTCVGSPGTCQATTLSLCGEGYHCGTGSLTCVANPALGVACTASTPCIAGYCDPATSSCTAFAAVGSACTFDYQCSSSSCLSGFCAPSSCTEVPSNSTLQLYDSFEDSQLNPNAPNTPNPLNWQAATLVTGVSAVIENGALTVTETNTASSTASTLSYALPILNPTAINKLEVDVGIASFTSSGPGVSYAVGLSGTFYNVNAVTAANDETGDIAGTVTVVPGGSVLFSVDRCGDATCQKTKTTNIARGSIPSVDPANTSHRLFLAFDPTTHDIVFGADGNLVVIDPATVGGSVTIAAPYGGSAEAPARELVASLAISAQSPTGTTITSVLEALFSDVYVGP